MSRRLCVILACLTIVAFPASGVTQSRYDYPPLYKAKAPPTKEEIKARDALHYYVLGLICEHEDRLIESLKAFEKSGELDKSAAAFKAQVALLLVLDRPHDALALAKKTIELDPGDFEVTFILARLFKVQGNYKEAIQALEKAVANPALKELPVVSQQIHFDLASMYETSEEFGKAATVFAKAAAILDHADSLDQGKFERSLVLAKAAETYERIGHLHRKAKQFDLALAAFKKAQERMPEGASRLNWNLAQVAAEQGQIEPALKYLDEYLCLQPLVMDPYHLKIDLLKKQKRTGDILPWLEKAVQADRHNNELKLLLARNYGQAGKTKEAETAFKTLIEENPTPDAYRGLFGVIREDASRGTVHVLFQINKTVGEAAKKPAPPGAIVQAKAIIGALREDGPLAKDLVDVAFRLGDKDATFNLETLHLLAALADKHRKNDEAERFYRKCLKETPPGLEHLVYGGLLRTLWKGRKYEAIIEICWEGIKKAEATNHLLFHNDLAKAQARLGRFKEALTQIDKAIDLAGDQHVLTVKLSRIRILAQADQYAQAEKECNAMLKEFSQPGDVLEVRYLLSSVYSGQKRMEKAEEQLELILKVDPANATANNDLGYLWADQNKHLDKAEEMIRRALDLDRRQRKLSRELSEEEDQDNAAYVDSLGWVHFRKGNLAEARKELERAVKLPGGEDPTLWDHLGDVYLQMEMYPDARRAWETSVRLYEKEERRKADEKYHEVQRKLKKVEKMVKAM